MVVLGKHCRIEEGTLSVLGTPGSRYARVSHYSLTACKGARKKQESIRNIAIAIVFLHKQKHL